MSGPIERPSSLSAVLEDGVARTPTRNSGLPRERANCKWKPVGSDVSMESVAPTRLIVPATAAFPQLRVVLAGGPNSWTVVQRSYAPLARNGYDPGTISSAR